MNWLKILPLIAVVGVIIGGYLYVNNLNNNIKDLVKAKAELTIAKKLQDETIEQLAKEREQMQSQLKSVFSNLNTIKQQNNVLQKRIRDSNIGQAAKEQPALVESTINKTSKNTNRCFEIASGSPLTDKEKKAKNAQDFNPECTWFYTR